MNEKQQVKLEVVRQNKMKNGQKSLITAPTHTQIPKKTVLVFSFFSVVSFSLTGSLNPNTVGRQANKRLVSCL